MTVFTTQTSAGRKRRARWENRKPERPMAGRGGVRASIIITLLCDFSVSRRHVQQSRTISRTYRHNTVIVTIISHEWYVYFLFYSRRTTARPLLPPPPRPICHGRRSTTVRLVSRAYVARVGKSVWAEATVFVVRDAPIGRSVSGTAISQRRAVFASRRAVRYRGCEFAIVVVPLCDTANSRGPSGVGLRARALAVS